MTSLVCLQSMVEGEGRESKSTNKINTSNGEIRNNIDIYQDPVFHFDFENDVPVAGNKISTTLRRVQTDGK